MDRKIFITGGQRSGKSSYAQRLAEEMSDSPIYLATARIWDDNFKKRVMRHKQDRGSQWITVEEEKEISKHDFTGQTVVLDCVTLWLTNFFFDNDNDIDKCLREAKIEFKKLLSRKTNLIIISNEIGMGGHPTNDLAMKFTDLQGWMNQYIASKADEAYLMVSGIPVKVK